MNRREFLQTTAAAAGVGLIAAAHQGCAERPGPRAVIASANGLEATERTMALLSRGEDTLEAVVQGVGLVEADPEDWSVGYGGLPNAEGVVQLDSSVMHGPTRGAGAVAAIEDIVHPARVAKQVMESTDHVLLVGEGALRRHLHLERGEVRGSRRKRQPLVRIGLPLRTAVGGGNRQISGAFRSGRTPCRPRLSVGRRPRSVGRQPIRRRQTWPILSRKLLD